MKTSVLLICFLLAKGVFSDVVKSVPEGDSVTLHTDLTDLLKYERILWTFGPGRTRIAQINNVVNKISVYNDVLDGKFRDRLQLDDRSGSLTVTNTTTEDSGLYELQTVGGKEVPPKTFSIIVSAPLPVPVITRNSSQCPSPSSSSSSSYCSLVCSVVNVGHVTLSWYKGNSLLSSISVSDLSISLSLPLEVEYQDKNSYSCVINNPISNQTQHLDISQLCHTCSVDASSLIPEDGLLLSHMVLICVSVVITVLVLAAVGMLSIYWKYRNTNQPGQAPKQEYTEMNNGSPGDDLAETDELKTVSVNVGETVTLNTGVTAVKSFDVLQWRFGELNTDSTNPFIVFARLNEQNNFDGTGHDETFRNRVQMDQQNGYLTISDIRHTDFGIYKLNISRNGRNVISKTFIVLDSSENRGNVPEETMTLMNGEITANTRV
uniref:Ig-like domain-containing protein n=1 Tax=Cyprinus carpio carpio TaxID=630221 RepID=A0A9J8CKF1_CYPCA